MIRVMAEFHPRDRLFTELRRHLDEVVTSRVGRILALRGRRQVGKSTAVGRFVEASKVAYVFVSGVRRAPSGLQLQFADEALLESRSRLADAELLASSRSATWRDWLGKVALAAREGPVIAVLDEFPWIAESDPTLEGLLQAQWDRVLEKLPVLLILIGSDVAMMEGLVEHGRPLYGRARQLAVPPLNPAEVARVVAGWSAFEVFDAFLVTGGYPRLVTDLARTGSVKRFVHESLSDAFSPLITNGQLTLDAEFPEGRATYQALAAIGADDTANPNFTRVAATLGEPGGKAEQTATTRALATLTERGLVARESPAWAAPSSRLRRYRVADPYLRFWFRYAERSAEQAARGRADLAIAAFDRDWSSWRGRSIEPVVRQALELLAMRDDRLASVERVLPWWTRDGSAEVDAVAMAADRTMLLGTIKWRERGGVTDRDVADLAPARSLVPRSAQARLVAISPSGESSASADVSLGAADLLGAWS